MEVMKRNKMKRIIIKRVAVAMCVVGASALVSSAFAEDAQKSLRDDQLKRQMIELQELQHKRMAMEQGRAEALKALKANATNNRSELETKTYDVPKDLQRFLEKPGDLMKHLMANKVVFGPGASAKYSASKQQLVVRNTRSNLTRIEEYFSLLEARRASVERERGR